MTIWTSLIAAAVIMPTLVAALAPRRRLIPVMALVVVSPAILYVAIIAWEMLTKQPQANPLELAVSGFMLISAFVALPWLVLCAIGFAIGLGLRRLVRGGRNRRAAMEPISGPFLGYGPLLYDETDDRQADPAAPVRLRVAATGRILVDCAGWESSRITKNADGSLFLHLRQHRFGTLFRIDPQARCFRNFGEAGPARLLSRLAAAVDAARKTAGAPGSSPAYREISPDGTIRIDLDTKEWSNSHWVNSPRVIEIATGRVLLDLWGTDWDANVSFPRARIVHLFLRRYRRGGVLAVDLDLARETYQIVLETGHEGKRPEAPLQGLAAGLEAASARSSGISGPVGMEDTPRPQPAWRVALIVIGTMLAVLSASALLAANGAPGPGQMLRSLWGAAWRAVR